MGNLTVKQKKTLEKNYADYLLKELSDEIYAVTDDPRKSLLDIGKKLEDAKPYLIAKDYLKLRMDLHKLTHGDKIQIDQRSVNINVEMKPEEFDGLMEYLDGKE